MQDSAIQNFLMERKANWLKNKLTRSLSANEKERIEQQATELFLLHNWLADAAKRAKQLSLVSHPGKFTHPSAKISEIIAKNYQEFTHLNKSNRIGTESTPAITQKAEKIDGYLRTGNVAQGLDVIGNAAALDVYRFLFLKLPDGQTILDHLEQDTAEIKRLFNLDSVAYQKIAKGLLTIKQAASVSPKTSEKIKQVYFPVGHGQYHLLSVLTPSPLVFELKKRIYQTRFSEQAREAREAKNNNHYYEGELKELRHLSEIGFGGTKPQNISALNGQYGGTSYLLSSVPPQLEKRQTYLPKRNFFGSYLNSSTFQNEFKRLFRALQEYRVNHGNTLSQHKKITLMVKNIIYHVADRMWKIRHVKAGWSDDNYFEELPQEQKNWLDQKYEMQWNSNRGWFKRIKDALVQWFFKTFRNIISESSFALNMEEVSYFNGLIEECEVSIQ